MDCSVRRELPYVLFTCTSSLTLAWTCPSRMHRHGCPLPFPNLCRAKAPTLTISLHSHLINTSTQGGIRHVLTPLDSSRTTAIMSARQAPAYQQGAPQRPMDDDSDVEEEALANDYREQVGYEHGDDYGMDSNAIGGSMQDLQAQLQAAATPLEYQATLETKIQSYDSYCNLFHYILNSEGPVDIEVPSVRISRIS